MDEKKTANKVAARLVIDLSQVRARIRELKETRGTMNDLLDMRGELNALIKIQSAQVL